MDMHCGFFWVTSCVCGFIGNLRIKQHTVGCPNPCSCRGWNSSKVRLDFGRTENHLNIAVAGQFGCSESSIGGFGSFGKKLAPLLGWHLPFRGMGKLDKRGVRRPLRILGRQLGVGQTSCRSAYLGQSHIDIVLWSKAFGRP